MKRLYKSITLSILSSGLFACSPAYSHVQEKCLYNASIGIVKCIPIKHTHKDTTTSVKRIYTSTGEYGGRVTSDGRMYDSKGKYVGKIK